VVQQLDARTSESITSRILQARRAAAVDFESAGG
jgi:hypothetical protein